MMEYSILLLVIICEASAQNLVITNGPVDAIACIGDTVNIPCGFVNESGSVRPDWRIVRRNNDGIVISDMSLTGSSIISNPNDGLQWITDRPSGLNHTNSVLVVGPVDESLNQSLYQCYFTVFNNDNILVNVTSNIGTLTAYGSPPSPGDITITEGCLSIITSWDPFTSDPVCGPVLYDVTISPSDGVTMIRINDTSYNFTGLTPDNSYTVTVAGRNDVGVGEPASVIVNAPTITNVLPYVSNLRNTRTTQDTITVSWDDAAGICSGLVTYFVTISTADETVLASVAIRNYLQFTFTDLMSNTSYKVTVLGANEFGNGTVTMINVTTGAVQIDREGASESSDDDDLSTGAAVVISVVVTFIITLVVTAVMTYIITRMYYKRQPEKIVRKNNNENSGTQDNSQFVLKGRDLKMDTNPSYAIIDKDTIKMDTNPAYVVTK